MTYDSKDLAVLAGVEAIQRRPGMFIGDVGDDGVAVCAREPFDNIIDEHMNGSGNRAVLIIDPEKGMMCVEDWARGIPVDQHPAFPGMSGLEVVLTKLNSGGKFSGKYGAAGGLHGVGLTATNAMSEWLEATVWRDGKEHQLSFRDGRVHGPMRVADLPKKDAKRTGTRIEFKLNPARFPDATSTVISEEAARRMCQQRAFLNPGLWIVVKYGDRPEWVFNEPNGIQAYAEQMQGKDPLFKKVAHFDNRVELPGVQVSVALAWRNAPHSEILAFCNSVNQRDGGTHVTGLKMSLPQAIKAYVLANKLIPAKEQDLSIEPKDCFEGVQAIVSIRHVEPVFKGQDKTALGNGDVQGAVQRLINSALPQWLEENPKEARLIGAKAVTAARAREAAARAREGVQKMESFGLSRAGKLADCSSRDPELTELFIVEGDSAGGSAKDGRDRKFQAVYPLKGKPANSWELDAGRTMENQELSELAAAIGTGLMEPGAEPAGLRYKRIIVMSDADIDGSHIQSLLLTHFFRHMRPLIERGHVYVGQPPLYRIGDGKKKYRYLMGERELGEFYAARAAKGGVVLRDAEGSPVPAATAALASGAAKMIEAVTVAALTYGYAPGEASYAAVLPAVADYRRGQGELDAALDALCTQIADRRRADGAEAVRHGYLDPGMGCRVVEGLYDGAYFVTIVDEAFMAASMACAAAVEGLLGPTMAGYASGAVRWVGRGDEREPFDFYAAARAFDAEARRGTAITRLKGLGEMNASELRDTTLKADRRTLIRITVADFDSSGELLNSLFSKGDRFTPNRRALLQEVQLAEDSIDA
jgi:DNA gyrase subunit B